MLWLYVTVTVRYGVAESAALRFARPRSRRYRVVAGVYRCHGARELQPGIREVWQVSRTSAVTESRREWWHA